VTIIECVHIQFSVGFIVDVDMIGDCVMVDDIVDDGLVDDERLLDVSVQLVTVVMAVVLVVTGAVGIEMGTIVPDRIRSTAVFING
jgi:hypothetical protein